MPYLPEKVYAELRRLSMFREKGFVGFDIKRS